MAKPTSVPRWATGAAQITEPTEAKKDTGWVPGEKPPAQYWNWWRKSVSDWLAYLNAITNEALTWAGKATFNAGLATPIAPTAANDVANKTYADARETTAKSYADGLITSLKAAANTWTAKQTLSGGAGGLPTPVAAGDAVTKTYADGLITSLLAAAQTWAAKQTFSAGHDVTGTIALVQAALQQIVKTGAGKLQVGTAAGNANDLELLVAGVVKLALLSAGGIDAKSQRIVNVVDPTGAQDAATKNYVDAGSADQAPQLAMRAGWVNTSICLTKSPTGIVTVAGHASRISGTDTFFATLPLGFRPPDYRTFPAVKSPLSFNTVRMDPDGLMSTGADSPAVMFVAVYKAAGY